MKYLTKTTLQLKSYTRLVLALFVMSVINLSFQIPAHAVLKLKMQKTSLCMQASMQMSQSSGEMSAEMHAEMGDMSNCHCPPAICDSVLAVETQSADGLACIQWLEARSPARLIETLDLNKGQLNQYQHYSRNQLNAVQTSPPPLLIKTLLLI